jgi:hypothetical protein
MATNQENICQMQYVITPNDAIAGMKNSIRKYLDRDLGLADFSSMFEWLSVENCNYEMDCATCCSTNDGIVTSFSLILID